MLVGTGIDIEEIQGFRDVLEHSEQALLYKLFTPIERAWADNSGDPAVSYAMIFAVKEAVLKAVSSRARVTLQDIYVNMGQPSVTLTNLALDVRISTSVFADSVLAFVIVQERRNLHGGY